jgi:hypothetical protein
MDEAAVRQLVRDALARHLQGPAGPVGAEAPWKAHVSHGRLPTPPPPDGSCVVEPAVRCSHCGFCQSYGH